MIDAATIEAHEIRQARRREEGKAILARWEKESGRPLRTVADIMAITDGED